MIEEVHVRVDGKYSEIFGGEVRVSSCFGGELVLRYLIHIFRISYSSLLPVFEMILCRIVGQIWSALLL